MPHPASFHPSAQTTTQTTQNTTWASLPEPTSFHPSMQTTTQTTQTTTLTRTGSSMPPRSEFPRVVGSAEKDASDTMPPA
eukprot:CAMPEP_0115509994 /NCGR_PEP_ID=MMETSP0271-20121206/73162_1 /TAXON_ID=71861 /ORGANISM="Scrippsiella trochoidea, Strain CCMP3099" /LENGTH=79 /DNA_ID=CAMNT_0002939901 /DNA_START=27 /DNA_END=263 /DNA_ORIENTATION=+